jgi:hypothetical protein
MRAGCHPAARKCKNPARLPGAGRAMKRDSPIFLSASADVATGPKRSRASTDYHCISQATLNHGKLYKSKAATRVTNAHNISDVFSIVRPKLPYSL